MFRVRCLLSKKGNEYYSLFVVRGGKEIFITFNVPDIARIAGISCRDVYMVELGDFIDINI